MAENRQLCGLCNRSVVNRRRYSVTRALFDENVAIAQYIIEAVAPEQFAFNGIEFICRPCWQRAQRAIQSNENPSHHECVVQIEEYSRLPNTSSSCIFQGCQRISLRRIPDKIKVTFLMNFNLFIPDNARVCGIHIISNDWDEIIHSPNLRHDFNSSHFTHILNLMKTALSRQKILDFEDIMNMEPSEIHFRLGIDREQFEEILNNTPSLADFPMAKTALAIFLMKLRTGDSNERLATLFGLSRRTMERYMKHARDCLFNEFVPRHLGFDSMDRRMVAQRNLSVPNALYGNPESSINNRKAIAIMDGTYIYVQKSSNYSFQRDTYSLHKYTNLLKPFLVVSSDGYIIDVCGPYAATDSDANILQRMLYEEEGPLHWFFRPGDVFILDRGFRDVLPDVRDFGYSAYMPETKDRGAHQLTTEQANRSRLVTMCRWVVEVINGWFKRDFKLLRQDYFNRALNHMFEDFKIAAALVNAFRDPIKDNVNCSSFIEIINERLDRPNHLADYVIRNNINQKRAMFVSITGDQPFFNDFPTLDENELILFALGIYQLKLARSYYAKHVRQGLYNIEVHREQEISNLNNYIDEEDVWLLRVRIQSRHVRSRIYYSYIIINRRKSGREAIAHYYCTCISGRRTIGCCAHIMCVVWYLGWARNQDEAIRLPAAELSTIIVRH